MWLCRPVDGGPEKHVILEGIQSDVMEAFRYIGDEIYPGGGCELATIARTRAAWGKFCELPPLLTSTTISLEGMENYMVVMSEVLYFMLENVAFWGEKKCNAFCVTNKQCYAGC